MSKSRPGFVKKWARVILDNGWELSGRIRKVSGEWLVLEQEGKNDCTHIRLDRILVVDEGLATESVPAPAPQRLPQRIDHKALAAYDIPSRVMDAVRESEKDDGFVANNIGNENHYGSILPADMLKEDPDLPPHVDLSINMSTISNPGGNDYSKESE